MNREQIENNRQRIIEELRSTKMECVENVIPMMDKGGFFTARCQRHDESEGGLANHSLWVLDFARRSTEEDPELLTLACLCRHVRNGYEKMGLQLSASMSETVDKAAEAAIEYADSIPFGSDLLPEYKAAEKDAYVDILFDQDDHVMWSGAEGRDDVFAGTETPVGFPVHHVMSVPVRPDGKGDDILVMYDDNSMYSLMFLSEEGEKDLHRSDKVMFGYRDLVFFITRYPMYRASYIAARNAKGLWGVLRVRVNRKASNDHLILVERVVDYRWRSADKAVSHMMSHSGNLISVRDSRFYTRMEKNVPTEAI